MIRQKITITDSGRVTVPSDVSMNPYEIAELFGVYTRTVHSNIRAVLKSGVIRPDISQGMAMTGNLIIPDVYGLDMVTALAFRIRSPNAGKFRNWVICNLGLVYSLRLHMDIDTPAGLN